MRKSISRRGLNGPLMRQRLSKRSAFLVLVRDQCGPLEHKTRIAEDGLLLFRV